MWVGAVVGPCPTVSHLNLERKDVAVEQWQHDAVLGLRSPGCGRKAASLSHAQRAVTQLTGRLCQLVCRGQSRLLLDGICQALGNLFSSAKYSFLLVEAKEGGERRGELIPTHTSERP